MGHSYVARIERNPEKSKHLETATTHMLGIELDFVNLRSESYCQDSRIPTMVNRMCGKTKIDCKRGIWNTRGRFPA